LAYVVIGHAPPAAAQVDQQRAQEYFKEAQALCERDGGRLWGVSICAPMVIGDPRTHVCHQPAPTGCTSLKADRSGERAHSVGQHDVAAVSWDSIANWPARTRAELLLHESFHIVQPRLVANGPAGANEHLDAVDGRYWLRLEWRALARALRESGELRAAEEQREQQRQARIAELRQRFVDAPVFVMACGGSGTSNPLGAVVIPGAGPCTSIPIACRDAAARSRPRMACRWRPMAARGVCGRPSAATMRRSPETGGRSRRRRDGLFAKEHGGETTTNLLDNAVHYTSAGGAVTIAVATDPSVATITVSDTGPGISAADRERIFERFVRLEPARSAISGAGRGLSIARWIAEQHEGTLTVEQAEPGGSRFVARLPLKPVERLTCSAS
jgi:anti-sigma regulatory factor (Ser/Thr protein kinase)